MGSAWDRAKEMTEKHASAGGIFIRLANDGDKVVGAFVGDPDAREVHWVENKYAECAGAGCAHCAAGNKASLRVSMNFWVAAENAMKVIEGGTMWFKDVLAVREKYGLDKWTFEVKRVGKPKDPKTKYAILPEEKIDEAIRRKIAMHRPHDLANLGRDEGEPAAALTPERRAEPMAPDTLDLATATRIAEQLKQLPRPEVDAFLARFRATRVRELRRADMADIEAYLGERLPQENAAEIDPFF